MMDQLSRVGTAQGVKSGGLLAVAVNGEIVTVQAARDITYALGDQVVLSRMPGGLWAAVARLGTAAVDTTTPPEKPPSPKPDVVYGTRVLTPVETRSRQGNRWRTDNDDVYQGQYGGNGNHIGCAFYGSAPRGLAGATVTAASVRMRRPNRGGAAAKRALTLRLVTEKTRPSGAPTLTSSTAGPELSWGVVTTWAVPTAWAQAMVDGTAGGLAVYEADGDPYVILDGRGAYGASFSLTLNWRR